MSRYEQKLKEKHDLIMGRLKEAREKAAVVQNPTAEEMYDRTEAGLKKSLPRDWENLEGMKLETDLAARGSRALPRPQISPSPESIETLKTIPVDADRRVEVRFNPEYGSYEYAASRVSPKQPEFGYDFIPVEGFPSPYYPSDIPPEVRRADLDIWRTHNVKVPPVIRREDIAKMSISPRGEVGFLNSSHAGAKEGAVDRLLMEAMKDGHSPGSSNLLAPGKRAVLKRAKEFQATPKAEYLKKIQNFLSTGKAGKVWSTAGHLIKPVSIGLTAAQFLTDPAEAAVNLATEAIGGVENLGVSEEQEALDRDFKAKIYGKKSPVVKTPGVK